MDRAEQREILQDIIDTANETIIKLNRTKKWLEVTVEKVEELSERLSSEYGYVDNFDEQELIESIKNKLFETELGELFEIADTFRIDIESYLLDLSEKQQVVMEEKYEKLDEVCDKFNQDIGQYEDIDNAIEHIEEAIEMLLEMLKQ